MCVSIYIHTHTNINISKCVCMRAFFLSVPSQMRNSSTFNFGHTDAAVPNFENQFSSQDLKSPTSPKCV